MSKKDQIIDFLKDEGWIDQVFWVANGNYGQDLYSKWQRRMRNLPVGSRRERAKRSLVIEMALEYLEIELGYLDIEVSRGHLQSTLVNFYGAKGLDKINAQLLEELETELAELED